MVTLTRLNGQPIVVNALLIEYVEETPDTMITLVTGRKITVLEESAEVTSRVTAYMQEIGITAATAKSIRSEGSHRVEK